MKTEEKKHVDTSTVAQFCQVLASLTIIVGMVVIGVAIAIGSAMEKVNASLIGLAVICGSVLWFAAARIITLLAQIAHNTES